MDKVVGFVQIKKDATTCKGAENPSEFINQTCPVMEFSFDESVLVVNPQGSALAMFDKEDIYTRFKCGYVNGVVTPPDLEMMEQMAYVFQVQNRKGGYNTLLKNMVIQASLMKGKFHDSFLWAKQ